MSKTKSSGLTLSRKPTAVDLLDHLHDRWWRLRTLVELLELCETAPGGAEVSGKMVAETAAIMFDELIQMEKNFNQLWKMCSDKPKK